MADDRDHCPGCTCHVQEQFVANLIAMAQAANAFADDELERELERILNDDKWGQG